MKAKIDDNSRGGNRWGGERKQKLMAPTKEEINEGRGNEGANHWQQLKNKTTGWRRRRLKSQGLTCLGVEGTKKLEKCP